MKKSRFLTAVLAIVLILSLCVTNASASGLLGLITGEKNSTVTITKSEYDELIALRDRYAKMEEMLEYIEAYYYQEPDVDAMIEMAQRGLLAGLGDQYTFYYNPEEWQEYQEDDEGEYAGIGIQLLGDYLDNTVTITRVFKNTPAEKAGIHKGDMLVRVEDIIVDATTMQAAVNVMRGAENTTVNVEVVRNGENIQFDVPRAVININRVDSVMLDNNVGYILLYEFAGECHLEVEQALKDLRAEGAESLVLDLRDNPGGWVYAAEYIADLFLDDCLLFYAEDRFGERENYMMTKGKDDIPLVILVNGNSASSSEILSGGLQDLGRAKVVGTQSFGKGIIQYVIPLSGEEGDAFQFTCAQYFTSSGKPVHQLGITPDVIVEQPEEQVNANFEPGDMTDTQLRAAWELAAEMQQSGN